MNEVWVFVVTIQCGIQCEWATPYSQYNGKDIPQPIRQKSVFKVKSDNISFPPNSWSILIFRTQQGSVLYAKFQNDPLTEKEAMSKTIILGDFETDFIENILTVTHLSIYIYI